MLSKNNLIHLVTTVLILCIIWVIFFVSKTVLIEDDSNITTYLPNETEWFIKIDGKSIFEKGFSSLMTSERLNTISELLNKQNLTDSEVSSKGINFQSDIILFELGLDSNKYFGAIVNVSNIKNFTENVINELSNKYGVRIVDNFAIIITENRRIKDTDIGHIVQKLTFGNNPDLHKMELPLSDLNFKILSQQLDGEISSNIDNSSISFNGKLSFNKEDSIFNQPHSTPIGLIPYGFHVSMKIIPNELNLIIDNNFGFDFPKIAGVSINHRSSDLTGQSLSSLAFDSDILICFEESTSVQQVLTPLSSLNHIESLDSNSFVHAGRKHYYHFISFNQLYIGVTPFRKEMIIKQNNHILISGSPKHIADIKGDGFARGLLGMIPEFSASEELFNNIESTQITLKRIDNDHFICNGTLGIKEDHSSYMEMVKFILKIKS